MSFSMCYSRALRHLQLTRNACLLAISVAASNLAPKDLEWMKGLKKSPALEFKRELFEGT